MKSFKSYTKINESSNSKLLDNIRDAFSELIDEGECTIRSEFDTRGVQYVMMSVTRPSILPDDRPINDTDETFKNDIRIAQEVSKRLSDIQECFYVAKELNNSNLNYTYYKGENLPGDKYYHFTVWEKTDSGKFWRKSPNGEVELNIDQIVKLAGANKPKSVKIHTKTSPTILELFYDKDWDVIFNRKPLALFLNSATINEVDILMKNMDWGKNGEKWNTNDGEINDGTNRPIYSLQFSLNDKIKFQGI